MVTDQVACYLRVLEEVVPEAWHRIEQYTNNRIEADHAQPCLPSFRTSAVATTNSPPMLHRSYVSRRPSMSSLKQFEPRPASDSQRLRSDNATKPVNITCYRLSTEEPYLVRTAPLPDAGGLPPRDRSSNDFRTTRR